MRDNVIILVLLQSFASALGQAIYPIIEFIRLYLTDYRKLWYRILGYSIYEIYNKQIMDAYIHRKWLSCGTNDNTAIFDAIDHKLSSSVLGYDVMFNVDKDGLVSRTPTGYVKYGNISAKYTEMMQMARESGPPTYRESKYTLIAPSHEECMKFINDCVQDYKIFIDTTLAPTRHIFTKNVGEWNFSKLHTECTFDRLHFPQKEVLLRYLARMESNEISKLVILLSGPPGCGKTSIIKAIMNHTARNIIDVNLANIVDADDLTSIFFDEQIKIQNKKDKMNLPLRNRIYVIEEIDTAGHIVAARKIGDKEVSDNDDEELDDDAYEFKCKKTAHDKKKKEAGIKPLTMGNILTTFDGIRELTNSITVLTTNHVDKLDPALVRPGRVTLHVQLDKCTTADAKRIVHDHPHLSSWDGDASGISPAQLGQFCDIACNVEQFKDLLINNT